MRLSQVVLEPVLRDIQLESPLVKIRYGWAFESFAEDVEGVNVTLRATATRERHQVRCALLAGCDGGGILVREKLGFRCECDVVPRRR
jgi:2-polyprenyl-6-methoxyphenol hydroxylase-like FAD-dependent oxidoreductase